MNTIFKRSIELNKKIEKFLDVISNSLLLFDKAVRAYLSDEPIVYEEIQARISYLETEADQLGSDIKISLYRFMLLPDARADVLSLIKSLDNIIDITEEITKDFHIQHPEFPASLNNDILELTRNTIASADSLLLAVRSFFSEAHLVSSHINHINFYEHEADLLENKINNAIFNGNLITRLAEKLQLKHFVSKITSISDESELIGEKLAIFNIKREI
ncbi:MULTISPECIES: DUF47 domain-containing protein [unclassified Fusibacter]|uniref:DUF47 domain-containing protein n=1 Tax=unclassified Fusibacter TaxID=2624464 RepID=UPI0010129143|nr:MULTISPECIES: DUF47 family protein [unclassified Fusibacter]MCK8060643.1 DUF47 family protein [Fusibacter sp. A2]NPE22903.1 DUF47 family protein [Fusibacter sp. A1]RXV59972.1 DUF47 family protein [Fusibacter sp. A1]